MDTGPGPTDFSVDRAHARRRLMWWRGFVVEHPVPALVRFATVIPAWHNKFRADFETDRSTNGVVEGFNRIKRIGVGFKTSDSYRL